MSASQRHPGLVREHFTYTGTPKRRFDSTEEAGLFRRKHRIAKSKRIYECSVCGGFHFGGKS